LQDPSQGKSQYLNEQIIDKRQFSSLPSKNSSVIVDLNLSLDLKQPNLNPKT